jgi:hypothetical protein
MMIPCIVICCINKSLMIVVYIPCDVASGLQNDTVTN